MDERNFGFNNYNYNESSTWGTPAPAENNTPAPAPVPENAPVASAPAPAPAVEETKAKKKAAKDFSLEEVQAILSRAEKVDLSRVAAEFGTTWQAVSALQKQAKNAKIKAKQKTEKPAKAPKVKKAKVIPLPKSEVKKSSEFTQAEKDAILERARKEGFREVAVAVGTNWQTLAAWNKQQKENAAAPAQVKVKVQPKVRAAKPVSAPKAPAVEAPKSTEILKKTKLAPSEVLEVENAILKEKLAMLTEQVEKLRAAVGSLA